MHIGSPRVASSPRPPIHENVAIYGPKHLIITSLLIFLIVERDKMGDRDSDYIAHTDVEEDID